MTKDIKQLEVLLKVSSMQKMIHLCNQAFLFRKRGPDSLPNDLISTYSDLLSTSSGETRQCIHTLSKLLKQAVFQGSSDPQEIAQLFPPGFHKSLRDVLTKITIENMTTWKNNAINGQVSLPKMVDFDWRVDMKTSSDSVARMSVPTCILNLQIQESSASRDKTGQVENVNVELSKETLDTMLDGLGKIRDQLASVANR